LVLTLTHLDARPLPTAFEDPRGRYVLQAGTLTLDPDGRMWLDLDLLQLGDSSGRQRTTLVDAYQRVGVDSMEFPSAELGDPPEFFGRWKGTELVLVARPAPAAGSFSVARQYGGAHTWRFVAR
jgi:hypothetical protein